MGLEALEKVLGYNFKNRKLLEEALTHPSMSFRGGPVFNYERLEFLGDSVLSLIICEYLYRAFGKESEGFLSRRKAMLVSKDALVRIARDINLGDFLILSNGEKKTGGRNNINNLENCMEAILGAIFLDSGFNEVKNIILRLWKNILQEDVPCSYKTILQELVQKKSKKLPEYIVEKREIINKQEVFTIRLRVDGLDDLLGSGTNIKTVEKSLAKQMVEIINKKKID